MAGVPFGHKDSVGAFPNHLAFPYDIVDKRSEYVITADIPGANRDMVEVSVDEDRVLHIVDERADRHEERGGSDEDGAKYVVYNRSFGRFERNFQLPEDVEDGAVDATMKTACSPCVCPRRRRPSGRSRGRTRGASRSRGETSGGDLNGWTTTTTT